MNEVWDWWHQLSQAGQAGIIAAFVTAFGGGLFGVVAALVRDHLRIAVACGTILFVFVAGCGVALYLSYKPADQHLRVDGQKPLEENLWFVYITTDQPGNLANARQDATRLRAELQRANLSLPVHIYVRADPSRSAVGVGEAASDKEAQQIVNRMVAAGWPKAAKNKSNGWNQVE